MHLPTLPTTAHLGALTSLTSATCYNTGLQFGEIRGPFSHDADSVPVDQAIQKFCQTVSGTTYYKGTGSWKACVNVPPRTERDSQRCQTCQKSCMEDPSKTGGQPTTPHACAALCARWGDCNANQPVTWWEMPMNRLEMEIRHDHPVYEEYMADMNACVAAMRTEVGACARGGEQTHDGFWYRIDPEKGACPREAGLIL